jgi:hypothetical protein
LTRLVGYGSYLNRAERHREGFPVEVQTGWVYGYERVFNKVSESGRWAHTGLRKGVMNVRRKSGAWLPVIVMEVPDDEVVNSHTREGMDSTTEAGPLQHYRVLEVLVYNEPQVDPNHNGPGNVQGLASMYVANELMCRRDIMPIDRYYFTCLDGAEEQGEEFFESYLDTTIVQWQGRELTVRQVESLNEDWRQIRRAPPIGIDGDSEVVLALAELFKSPYLSDQLKYVFHSSLIRKAEWQQVDPEMPQPSVQEVMMSLERGVYPQPGWGWIQVVRGKFEITIHNWCRILWDAGIKRNLYQTLLHELGHIDLYNDKVNTRFGGQSEAHVTCDEHFKAWFDQAVLGGEVEADSRQIKQGDRFPGEDDEFEEIIIRPFKKMDRMDGEIVLRREVVQLTPTWDQLVWKVSKWSHRRGVVFTYWKFEHAIDSGLWEAIAFINSPKVNRRVKVKTFDDGTEFTYLSTSRANYVKIGDNAAAEEE